MYNQTIHQEHSPHMTVLFDTLAYAKKLKAVGVPEVQAEVQAEAIAELMEQKLATKDDIRHLQKDMRLLEERLTYKLSIRFGSMLIAAVTVLAILIKIL